MRQQPDMSGGESFAPPEKDKLMTDNLLMEFVSKQDAPRMFAKFDKKLFERWGIEDENQSELAASLGKSRELALDKHKTLLDLSVHEKTNRSKIIGRCGIFPNRKKGNGEYRLNLWLDTPGAETKFAVEIVERLIQWINDFRKNQQGIITGLTFAVPEGSTSAKKVLEKLGDLSPGNKLSPETIGEGEEEKDVAVYRIPLG